LPRTLLFETIKGALLEGQLLGAQYVAAEVRSGSTAVIDSAALNFCNRCTAVISCRAGRGTKP